jgi:hypothetical protein
MLLPLFAGVAAAATPFFGLEWRPLSRADLTWVDDNRTTGTSVGEQDGALTGALRPYGGAWFGARVGVVGGLGVASLTSTSWADEVWRRRTWTVIRPSADLRFALVPNDADGPRLWALAGGWGDIPVVRDLSNGFSEAEAEAADLGAQVDRARLGGIGARVGLGAEVELGRGVSVGAQWTVEGHRGTLRTAEVLVDTRWVSSAGSLLLSLAW